MEILRSAQDDNVAFYGYGVKGAAMRIAHCCSFNPYMTTSSCHPERSEGSHRADLSLYLLCIIVEDS